MNNASQARPKTSDIQISEWKSHNRKTLRGFFTATLPSGMILHDLSLHEKPDARWINTPSREWTDQNGDTQYSPMITFTDRATANRFRDTMLAALDEQKPWEQSK